MSVLDLGLVYLFTRNFFFLNGKAQMVAWRRLLDYPHALCTFFFKQQELIIDR